MAEGILYNFAAGILQRLASEVVNEIGLIWGVKEKLLSLEDTMSMIKDVLLDAQEQRIHRHHIKNWLSRLEDVVQDFEDLLDYMETDALRRQGRSNKNQLLKEVCNFFSSSNRVAFRFKMAHWLEDTKKKLAIVQADRREFQLEVRLEEAPLVASDVRFEQTHSFVPEEEVIGRDSDKSNIINKLLNVDQTNQHVSTIAIVGCGGMGKTSLAQLVFNDKNIQNHFQLKLWVCVSDVFVVKTIVEQIINSATNKSPYPKSQMDQLQNQLRNELKDKRYLLILDDVWNDDFSKWDKLRVLLGGGAMGSRILVTTRNTKVANITGDQEPYHIGILDDGFSWSLFKKIAFKEGYEGNKSIEDIGYEILKKCGGIPIVIKTIGSMLRFKDAENEWQQFLDKELSKVPQYADNILPRLELSYNHLPSHLKHCFAFCSLYPKDYEFRVKGMIRYWIALGFVNSPDQSRSLEEDVGFEYFKELLSRSFFQQVQRNKWGDIWSCKMHDFIRDLAIKVAGTECISLNSKGGNIGKRNRHLSFHRDFEQPFPTYLLQAERIQTILNPFNLSHLFDDLNIYKIISSMKRIRLLDLNNSNIERVPKSIDKLLHLRYLDLSFNKVLTTLPNSLCKLQNLQTLILNVCQNFQKWPKDFGKLVNLRRLEFMCCKILKEWPKDIDKLVNLRHLNFENCDKLKNLLPRGLSQLTNLQTLSPLEIDVNMEFGIGKMGDLKNLRGGKLAIVNLRHQKYEISKANLKEKQFNSIILEWENNGEVDNDEAKATADEETLQDLQPSQNLKELKLDGYCGYKCSSWFESLTNVFRIELKNCKNLKYLPGLAHLPALKELILVSLPALVCISSNNSEELICRSSSSSSKSTSFFPSLKKLTLKDMPSLKGWWNINDEDNSLLRILPTFPCLSKLTILKCPRLNCMPFFPSLDKRLRFDYISWKGILQSTLMMNDIEGASTTTSSASHLTKLRKMTLTDSEDIESLLLSSKNLTSLKYLEIEQCSRLKSIFSGIQHLTSLQTLSIDNCEELELLFDDVTMSKSLVNLSFFYLNHLPKVEAFPDCISNLKSLKVLCIEDLENLNSSGLKGICSLPSLVELSLWSCKRLSTLPQEICRLSSSLKKLSISHCLHFHSLPGEIFSLTSLEILTLTRLPELKSLPQKHLLDNIQEIKFWNNKKEKVFIKSVQSQDRDPPTNLKLHIMEIPHLEKPVRNSGFSLSYERNIRI